MNANEVDLINACETIALADDKDTTARVYADWINTAYNNLGKAKFEQIVKSHGVLDIVKPYVPAYADELRAERLRKAEWDMAMDMRDHYREYGHY